MGWGIGEGIRSLERFPIIIVVLIFFVLAEIVYIYVRD